MHVDAGGKDKIPHTFLVIKHDNGNYDEYGFTPQKEHTLSGPGKIEVKLGVRNEDDLHESQFTTPSYEMNENQYNKFIEHINFSIENPSDYLVAGKGLPGHGNKNCTGWAVDIWNKAGLPNVFGVTNKFVWNPYGQAIFLSVSKIIGTTPDPLIKLFKYADPLILDLTGNGFKITPLSSGVMFDAEGDGIKTNTAWANPEDGILVWDRNKNGLIDSGKELFGDATLLLNGQTAEHGFAALKELDMGNKDKVLDAKDSLYSSLSIWRDLNLDGISQSNELSTLAENGIVSIQLNSKATSLRYGDALLTQTSTFTRADGTTGQIGNFILAQNNFVRTFPDLELSETRIDLPNLKGSGWVRDLQEAVTLNPELISFFNKVKYASSRQEYKNAIANFVKEWGMSSDYINASKQALKEGYGLILNDPKNDQERVWIDMAIKASDSERADFCATLSADDLIKFNAMCESMTHDLIKLYVYEAFSGHTFLNWSQVYADATAYKPRINSNSELNEHLPLTMIINQTQNGFLSNEPGYIRVNIPLPTTGTPQIESLWNRLVEDLSNNLMPSLYLQKYLDLIEMNVTDTGVHFDLSNFNLTLGTIFKTNTYEGATLYLDLYRHHGKLLIQMGWNGTDIIQTLLDKEMIVSDIHNAISDTGFNFVKSSIHSLTVKDEAFSGDILPNSFQGHAGNDLINGGGGNDILSGGAGDDLIFGGPGNDTLTGNKGDDILDGGPGNDMLRGGPGNNIYLFGKGDGEDLISDFDYGENLENKLNILQFKSGISPADIHVARKGSDLIVSILGTTDKITIDSFFLHNTPLNSSNPIQEIRFQDGTTWDVNKITSSLLNGTDLADKIIGTPFDDIIDGKGGDDLIYGNDGNDILYGSLGNDRLYGEKGNDTLYGGPGNDTLYAEEGDDILIGGPGHDTLIGGLGDDILDGGPGNDMLRGGYGNNTYLFGRGDGEDIISGGEYSGNLSDKLNILEFKSGILPTDIQVARKGSELILSITGTTDKITMDYFFSQNTPLNPANPIQQVKFHNGTIWDVDTILSYLLKGTDFSDTIIGTSFDDIIDGKGGSDLIYGYDGNDVLYGGLGNDRLYGGKGNDTLYGGPDNDTLYGEEGDDILIGGPGNDTLIGGLGNDLYLFGKGDGQDVICADQHKENLNQKLNILEFNVGIFPSDITANQNNTDLTLSIKNTTDKITIQKFSSEQFNPVQQIKFSNGSLINTVNIEKLLSEKPSNINKTINLSDVLDIQSSTEMHLSGNNPLNDIYIFPKAQHQMPELSLVENLIL